MSAHSRPSNASRTDSGGYRSGYPILKLGKASAGEVEPHGVLQDGSGKVVATFEAKYTVPSAHPKQEHRYQALATAAVLHSPLSVLVYPGTEAARIYDVQGFNGQPAHLATFGLDLYTYEREAGDATRARGVTELLIASADRIAGADCQASPSRSDQTMSARFAGPFV